VAYYASQRKGSSIHSPRSCIPGGGWRITEFTRRSFPEISIGKDNLTVNRLVIQMGTTKQLVYYWFLQRGRIITNEYLVKWYLFWDALTRNRTDGALVRLTTTVSSESDIDEADRELTDFAKTISLDLSKYVPD
jgi:EpsI family protein